MSDHATHLFTRKTLRQLKAEGKDFTAHSIFAPSGSPMWAYCSGSLIPNLFAPDQPSIEAAEGTVAHWVAERWLKSGERPDHLLGVIKTVDGFDIEVTKDMLDHLDAYVQWCQLEKGLHFTERRVDFSDLTPIPNQKGTADYFVMQPGKLTVKDLKYGEGIQVYAQDSTQGLLYGYGVFKEYDELFDFQEIVIEIGQPRFDHWDSWTLTREEFLEWIEWLKERAYLAWKPNAPRVPSTKSCQWCKIKNDCAAYAVYIARMNDDMFDDLTEEVTVKDMNMVVERLDHDNFQIQLEDPGKLSLEHKLKISKYAGLITDWLKKIKTDIDNQVLGGVDIPEKKIIMGRSTRKFVNEEVAAEHLIFLGIPEDKVRPRGMIGITEMERELVKAGIPKKSFPAVLKSIVVKPPGAPTVVDVSHPAPRLISTTENMFDDLDADL